MSLRLIYLAKVLGAAALLKLHYCGLSYVRALVLE